MERKWASLLSALLTIFAAIIDLSELRGVTEDITVKRGSPVTYFNTIQTLECTSATKRDVWWKTDCSGQSCPTIEMLRLAGGGQRLVFSASARWNSSDVSCGYVEEPRSSAVGFRIFVRSLPKLKITPAVIDVYLFGDAIDVQCSADTTHLWPPDLRWSVVYKDGVTLDEGAWLGSRRDDETESNLTFLPPELEQVNTVLCSFRAGVRAPFRTKSQPAKVQIYGTPAIQITPNNQTFRLGSEVKLTCATMGYAIGGLVWTVACNGTCSYEESIYSKVSAHGVRRNMTFFASYDWDGAIVRCHPPSHKRIAATITVRVRQLPLLELVQAAPEVEVYYGKTGNVLCRARGSEELPAWSTLRWIVSKNTTIDAVGLSYAIASVSKGSTLTFAASATWQGREIACELATGDAADGVATRRTATVRLYEVPNLRILPLAPSFDSGANASLTCVSDGYVIDGLEWHVACSTCNQRRQGVARSSWRSTRKLTFVATPNWDGTIVSCSVRGRSWLSTTKLVEVTGYSEFSLVGWRVLSTGILTFACVASCVAVSCWRAAKDQQKSLESHNAAPSAAVPNAAAPSSFAWETGQSGPSASLQHAFELTSAVDYQERSAAATTSCYEPSILTVSMTAGPPNHGGGRGGDETNGQLASVTHQHSAPLHGALVDSATASSPAVTGRVTAASSSLADPTIATYSGAVNTAPGRPDGVYNIGNAVPCGVATDSLAAPPPPVALRLVTAAAGPTMDTEARRVAAQTTVAQWRAGPLPETLPPTDDKPPQAIPRAGKQVPATVETTTAASQGQLLVAAEEAECQRHQ